MADPRAVVPYHDPFDSTHLETLLNFDDHPNPSIANLEPVSSFPPQPRDDGFIQDDIDPFDDPSLWEFCVDPNSNDNQAGPSEVRGETSNQNEENWQNLYGNSMQISFWPVPAAPFVCSCCQVLREIIHTNGVSFSNKPVCQ